MLVKIQRFVDEKTGEYHVQINDRLNTHVYKGPVTESAKNSSAPVQ